MLNWRWFPQIAFLALGIRNLRIRWVRTALTTVGIIVGVATMVAVNTANSSTLNAISRFFDEASGRSDLLVGASVSGEGFSEEVLNVVRRFPEVEAAAPALVEVTLPAEASDNWEREYSAGGTNVPGSNFWLMGIDPAVDGRVHDYQLVAGRLLEDGESNYSVVLVSAYATEQEIEVGDDFALLTPAGVARLRVVGLIAKEGIGITNDGVIGFAPLTVVQELFNQAGEISQIELLVAADVANNSDRLEGLRLALAERLGEGYAVNYPAARGEVVANSIQNYQLGLNFFSVVSLFVGSFLIYNAFAMTVVERTREIGMLRAVGMTRRQVLTLVLFEAVTLGWFGSLLGVGAGLLLARGLVLSVSGFTGQRIEAITAAPDSLVSAFVVGVSVTLFAALLPAIQAAQISPMQALRVKGNVDERRWVTVGLKFGPLTTLLALLILYAVPLRREVAFAISSNSIFLMLLGTTLCIPLLANSLERLIRPLVIFLFGNEGRLGSSNINRARGRTTLTVAALMVGISMVIGIQGMTHSFEYDIQAWIDTALGGDLFVDSPVPIPLDLEPRLLSLPGVEAVTRTRFVSSRLVLESGHNEFAIFTAIDPATYLTLRGLRIQEGPSPAEAIAEIAAGDAVLVGADTATKHQLSVGDTIFLETRRGQRPFRIAAVVIDFAAGELPAITGSWSDLRRYFGLNDVSSFAVKLAPGGSLESVSAAIENGLDRSQKLSVESKAEFQGKIEQLSGEAFALFDVLGLIGLVVAMLGVINTMLMNVLERTRELGGLRSVGMTQSQVRRMILAEAGAIGLIGGVFGLGVGVVLIDIFLTGLRSMGGFVLTTRLPTAAMALSFILAVLLSLVAAYYPAVRASRVNIIQAIKME